MTLTYNDIYSIYHTTIQTIGVFTSMAFALLSYSQYYRSKNQLYNIAFIGLSITFVILSIIFCKYLLIDNTIYINHISKEEQKIFHKWMNILNILYYILLVLLCFNIGTLLREIL